MQEGDEKLSNAWKPRESSGRHGQPCKLSASPPSSCPKDGRFGRSHICLFSHPRTHKTRMELNYYVFFGPEILCVCGCTCLCCVCACVHMHVCVSVRAYIMCICRIHLAWLSVIKLSSDISRN